MIAPDVIDTALRLPSLRAHVDTERHRQQRSVVPVLIDHGHEVGRVCAEAGEGDPVFVEPGEPICVLRRALVNAGVVSKALAPMEELFRESVLCHPVPPLCAQGSPS